MSRTPPAVAGLLLLASGVVAADPLPAPTPLPPPAAVARPINADDVRAKLNLLPDYAAVPGLKTVKVAVLDSGFAGLDGKRPYLPAGAVVVEHYGPDFVRKFGLGDPDFTRPFTPGEAHGRAMAQLVWAVTGHAPDGPQFYLLNANGPTMFRRAVRFAVEMKVDVILFSGTFEAAGNYDGLGPINAVVDQAIAAGIVWVNAAGNGGGMVYNGPVEVGPDGYLTFRTAPLKTALRFTNKYDENAVTVTLTWNDYQDAEDAGTEKDLDLIVEDGAGRVVGESKQTQVPAGAAAGEGQSKNPRERLVLADLPAAAAGKEYRIRVKAKGNNFGPRDRVRVLVSATKDTPYTDAATGKVVFPVEFLDATRGGEVYPPADHAGVVTVGDSSRFSAVGPTADGRVKPDVILTTAVARFSNGEESAGSSNAAAYFAGVVALMRAREPGLTAGHVRTWVRRLDQMSKRADPLAPPPSAFPAGLPTPPAPVAVSPTGMPLSPNEQRALKYADGSLTDKTRQPGLAPRIEVSSPGGTYQVQPVTRPPAAPPRGVTVHATVVRAPAGAPATATQPAPTRPEPPHAPWTTPTAKQLAALVNGP